MNVLEKILEEIDTIKKEYDNEKYHQYFVDGANCAISDIRALIRSQMDDVPDANVGEWIPVSERQPEHHKNAIVTVHSSEWISDYVSRWVPDGEKKYHPDKYFTTTGYINKRGNWRIFDEDGSLVTCDKEFGKDKGEIYYIVTGWKPLPEPYKG